MSITKEYLSDVEISKIESFVEDEVLIEAVRKVLLASIYSNGTLRKDLKANPLVNSALALVSVASSGRGVVTNNDLGEDLRGLFHGIQLLESGLRELSTFKKEADSVESPYNIEKAV